MSVKKNPVTDFVDDATEFVNRGLDLGVQTVTGGLVKYQGGTLQSGPTGDKLIKGYKDLTGVTATEQFMDATRQSLEQEQALRLKEQQSALQRQQASEVQMSTAGSRKRRRATLGSAQTTEDLDLTSDFLGV